MKRPGISASGSAGKFDIDGFPFSGEYFVSRGRRYCLSARRLKLYFRQGESGSVESFHSECELDSGAGEEQRRECLVVVLGVLWHLYVDVAPHFAHGYVTLLGPGVVDEQSVGGWYGEVGYLRGGESGIDFQIVEVVVDALLIAKRYILFFSPPLTLNFI